MPTATPRSGSPASMPRSWMARASQRLGAFAVTAVLGLSAVGAFAEQCAPPPSPQQQVVSQTNQRRAERGLPALSVNSRLTTAAQQHSADQANRNHMTHTGSDGSNAGQRITAQGYRWSAWAENVAAGQRDATAVMDAWMNSSGHRANILSTKVTQIGVGLAYSSDNTPYWTMVLAKPG